MKKSVLSAAPKFAQAIIQSLQDGLHEYIVEFEGMIENDTEDSDEIRDWFVGEIKGKRSWELYRDGRELYVVTNVKGKGFPDYDTVVEQAARQAQVDEAAVRSYVTPDFFESHFWDMVQYELENFDTPVSRVGRSGGYWGVEV